MNVSRQRRAIYTGMRPYLKDAELQSALALWQEKYVDKPHSLFTQFLTESCHGKELRSKRSTILGAIFNALNLPESDLLPDPYNAQTNQFETVFSPQDNHEDSQMVFVAFVQTLLSHLNAEQELKVRSYLVEHCESKFSLNVQQMLALKMWLNRASEAFEMTFNNDDKRELINLTYIAMCQHIGPVKADQVLSMSIKETEALAKQHQVNLHGFL